MKKTIIILFVILSNFIFADIFDDVRNDDIEAVKKYIQDGGDLNVRDDNGYSILNLAAYEGMLDIATILLKNGIDVDQATNEGHSSLMIASGRGWTEEKSLEIIKVLIKYGADINKISSDKSTALLEATSFNPQLSIVKYLIENGAKIDVTNESGDTPLISASCDENGKEVVKLLLISKALVNIQNKVGETALIVASKRNYKDIVKLLIDYKADSNLKNNVGKTVYDIAVENGALESLKLLPNVDKKDTKKVELIRKKEIFSSFFKVPEGLLDTLYASSFLFPPLALLIIAFFKIWPIILLGALIFIIKKLKNKEE